MHLQIVKNAYTFAHISRKINTKKIDKYEKKALQKLKNYAQ